MPFDLSHAMQAELVKAGYEPETALKTWIDVCHARGEVRNRLYDSRKNHRVSFDHYGLKISGVVCDVRINEDRGVEYYIDINSTKIWVREAYVYVS